ncbi:MAG: nuclear transport factor 2 family protein [Robiginitalea sp.]|jgi:iron-sulfur cluster repair protein YtfE (RIC family)
MRYSILLFCTLAFFTSHAQSEPEKEVRAAIEHFFEGFHQRDTAKMRKVLHQDIHMQRIGKNQESSPALVNESIEDFLSSLANLPDTLQIEERLLAYHIQTDGDMAHAWTPYEFYLQGEFHHCGVNSFQLFRDPEGWKIIYLVDTRRVKDCTPAE